jgi:hypothetical protein
MSESTGHLNLKAGGKLSYFALEEFGDVTLYTRAQGAQVALKKLSFQSSQSTIEIYQEAAMNDQFKPFFSLYS